jgi:hypothetical protein
LSDENTAWERQNAVTFSSGQSRDSHLFDRSETPSPDYFVHMDEVLTEFSSERSMEVEPNSITQNYQENPISDFKSENGKAKSWQI